MYLIRDHNFCMGKISMRMWYARKVFGYVFIG